VSAFGPDCVKTRLLRNDRSLLPLPTQGKFILARLNGSFLHKVIIDFCFYTVWAECSQWHDLADFLKAPVQSSWRSYGLRVRRWRFHANRWHIQMERVADLLRECVADLYRMDTDRYRVPSLSLAQFHCFPVQGVHIHWKNSSTAGSASQGRAPDKARFKPAASGRVLLD